MKLNAGFTGASFFDAPKVIRAVTKTEHRVLSRFGAIVRRRARSSIRKRKANSKPGEPPSSHTGFLKQGIMFGFDTARRSVVVGPRRFRGGIADVLEYGGGSRLMDEVEIINEGGGRDSKGRFLKETKRRTGRKVRRRIAARPFMGPAFQDALPELPAMWRNSIR